MATGAGRHRRRSRSATKVDAVAPNRTLPVSLAPAYNESDHGTYRDVLVALLQDDLRRANVYNIALSGPYGSGKSSILAGVREKMPRRVVEVSLSSLNDVGGLPYEKGSEELNNYIQKEIVKQLLYRERPSRVPGSRFRRVSRMPKLRAIAGALLAGAVAAIILWLTGWGSGVNLPSDLMWTSPWWPLAVITATVVIVYVGQALFHNQIRIDKLGTSTTSVSLATESQSESYFDKYLDEIVYFFERTRRDVVLLEDLDRFEHPAIYASLRELNTLLNASNQLRKRPVHFIYAVRDSIFEDIEIPARKEEKVARAHQSGVWQAHRELSDPATQRAKFFELVVPIVPFITHQSAADLLYKRASDVDPKISYDVVRVVAKHITDMRLLLNILNEYRVFSTRVLFPGKIEGLTESRLFAIVAYKNTHLEDFELIRVGSSNIDTIYRRSREVIGATLDGLSEQIENLEGTEGPDPLTTERAAQLGARLQALVSRLMAYADQPLHVATYWIGGEQQSATALSTIDFWSSYIDGSRELTIRASGTDLFIFRADQLQEDLGMPLPALWQRRANQDARRTVESLREAQGWIRTADIADLFRPRAELIFKDQGGRPLEDHRGGFLELITAEVTLSPLLEELLTGGHLDRNFALYASEFHGVVSSARAMTYVVQHLQPEKPDPNYQLFPADVATILELGGARVFRSPGLFNVSIYDTLLGAKDRRLEINLSVMAHGDKAALDFIRVYLRRGIAPEDLMRGLAHHWAGIFEFIEEEEDEDQIRTALALAALEGVNSDVDYSLPSSMRALIARSATSIRDLTDTTRSPQRIAETLQQLCIPLLSLANLTPQALQAVASMRQYEVNPANLRAVVGEEQPYSLDAIMALDDSTFDHVLTHMNDYLAALDDTNTPSITSGAKAKDVIEAVENAEVGLSIEIARRMPPNIKVDDIADLSVGVLPGLAETGRFRPTVANLHHYISIFNVDGHLLKYLAETPQLVVHESATAADRQSVAYPILQAQEMDPATRSALAQQLVGSVQPTREIAGDGPLIGRLLADGLLPDGPTIFAALTSVEAQEAFAMESPTTSEWIVGSTASADLIARILRSNTTPRAVTEAIADALPSHAQWATPEVINALGEWAERDQSPFRADTVQLIQASLASTAAKVAVLNASVGATPALVATYVSELEGEYPSLLEKGTTPVTLPATPDPRAILAHLRDSFDVITSFRRVGDDIRVYRNPPAAT